MAGAGTGTIWWEQMYNEEFIPGENAPGKPRLLFSSDERKDALSTAAGLCIVSDGAALPEAALDSVLAAAPGVQRCVLLSKMGVSRASAGPLGTGKDAVEQLSIRAHHA